MATSAGPGSPALGWPRPAGRPTAFALPIEAGATSTSPLATTATTGCLTAAWRAPRRPGGPGSPTTGRCWPTRADGRSTSRRSIRPAARGELSVARPPAPLRANCGGASDGRRLVAVAQRSIRTFDARGRVLSLTRLPRGLRAGGSALDPRGRRLALIAAAPGARSSELLLVRTDRAAPPRRRLGGFGPLEGVTWSIDGRVLVAGLPQADQWLFLRLRGKGGLASVKGSAPVPGRRRAQRRLPRPAAGATRSRPSRALPASRPARSARRPGSAPPGPGSGACTPRTVLPQTSRRARPRRWLPMASRYARPRRSAGGDGNGQGESCRLASPL